MKTTAAIYSFVFILISIWMMLTFTFRNTYFRPLSYELEDVAGYHYEFESHASFKEKDPKQRMYYIAVERGDELASHLFYPAIFLNVMATIGVWHLAIRRKKVQTFSPALPRKRGRVV